MEAIQEVKDQSILDAYAERAKEAEALIPDVLKNGAGYTPYDDMVLYMIICTPKLTEEEMKGMDQKVLDVLFEGDKEEDITNQRLILISKGDGCKKDMKPGDQIAVRGHAFKVVTPKGTFLTVREYDVIGKYE